MDRNFLTFLVIVGGSWWLELATWQEASRKIEVQSSKRGAALLSKLLSGLYDAVVSLDDSLNITDRTPKLAALLLRRSAFGESVEGIGPTSFMSVVHQEDHDKLQTYIETSCSMVDELEVAPSIHIRLLDSNGIAVPVMIISSTLDAVAGVGKARHMLGINMVDEGLIPAPAQDTFSVSVPQSGFPAPSSNATARESASSGSDTADMHVWVDAASPRLTVLASSGDFAMLAGPRGPCSVLSEWLTSSDLCKVKDMVQANAPGGVSVRLIPEDVAWAYKCVLSIDAVQNAQAAPLSSQSVCLIVDSLVCKIFRPSSRMRVDQRLQLWARVTTDDDVYIVRASGEPRQLVNAFLAERHLCSWVGQEFLQALIPIMLDLANGGPNALPRKMGTFPFRSPDRCQSPIQFQAKVTLSDFENDLYHFRLKMVSLVTPAV
jgi:hypothetical protein